MSESTEPPARGSSLDAEPTPQREHNEPPEHEMSDSSDHEEVDESQEERIDSADESVSSENESAEEEEGHQRHGETWQSFLQQVSPQDIALRDPSDPVRRAYLENRHREVAEGTQQRRRAATAASYLSPGQYQSTSQALVPNVQRDVGMRRRPMSLQIQNRPLPPPPPFEQERQAFSSEYIVPRWQPDHEASHCPICGHEFNIFFRRHHCRKCGRVVCANCSPHRITIPQQFIVQPPAEGEQSVVRRTRSDLISPPEGDEGASQGLGGGEEVRLCNPCVPDPNPLPPPSYLTPRGQHFAHHHRGESLPADGRGYSPANMPNAGSQDYPRGHNRPGSMSFGQYPPSLSRRQYNRTQRWSGGPNAFLAWNQQQEDPNRLRSPYGSAPVPGYANWPRTGSQFNYTSDTNAPLPPTPPPPPPPPPPLREEDECPVCHSELPPKGADGSEAARETHVVACIQSHFSTSGPRSAHPPPEAAVAAAIVATSATPGQVGGITTASSGMPMGSAPGPASPRRRAPGMLVYHATEKDCVGEDEMPQECVICFEEFEVGVEMGRLECLCKFHRWWDTKGVGACPVHQNGV